MDCGPVIDTALVQMFKDDTSKVGRRDWLVLPDFTSLLLILQENIVSQQACSGL
jgi:hypothetical protein